MSFTHLLRDLSFVTLVLSIGACGAVDGNATPDATSIGADAPSIDGAIAVLDRSCAEVKARLATATDGAHWIDPDLDGTSYKPFRVFCANMAGPAPEEYLELARTSLPADEPSANYATFATGIPHAAWTCDCGVATTLYSKVRIDPVRLMLLSTSTFAVFSASTQLSCLQTHSGCPGTTPYAAAASCVTNYDASGRANVDLRDVPFHVVGTGTDTSMFKRYEDFNSGWGFQSDGSATIDDMRKIVNVTGGGDCGGFGALDGLPLAQDL